MKLFAKTKLTNHKIWTRNNNTRSNSVNSMCNFEECNRLESDGVDRFDLGDLDEDTSVPGKRKRKGKLRKSKKEDSPPLADVVDEDDEGYKKYWKNHNKKNKSRGRFRSKRQIDDPKYIDFAVLYDHDFYADAEKEGEADGISAEDVISEWHTAVWNLVCSRMVNVSVLMNKCNDY